MTLHFIRAIDDIKKNLFMLSGRVEENVRHAVNAVDRRDIQLAHQVMRDDHDIDEMEVVNEEKCMKILALHQPVAIDLRFLIAVLKINNDLERIGDLAVNVAERAIYITGRERIDIPFDFPGMADLVQEMLRKSLDSLVNMDEHLALSVCEEDNEVDAINRKMYNKVKEGMRENPENIDILIHMLCISRHLERIADHATNIAEDVIYMVTGKIARHSTEDFTA